MKIIKHIVLISLDFKSETFLNKQVYIDLDNKFDYFLNKL
jgi:hypothetical protein